ncbi:Actin-depolymerizing factor 2, isoform c, partial [Trichinella nelsoni]
LASRRCVCCFLKFLREVELTLNIKMSSGVTVNPDCRTTFQLMAEGRKDLRYIIFSIVNDKEVVVEKAICEDDLHSRPDDDYADNSKTAYLEFVDDLKQLTDNFNDCRYAVFDFKFTGSREGAGVSKMSKIVFLQVCPDGASVKRKMVYASSASAIKAALGTSKLISLQISDESELCHSDILRKLHLSFPYLLFYFHYSLINYHIPYSHKYLCYDHRNNGFVLNISNISCLFFCIGKKCAQASGVKIDPQCKKDYDDMHSRKMYSYLIFRISDDDTTIIVEKKGLKGASYKEFQDELAKAVATGKECRYGCVDVEFAVQRQGTESVSSIRKVVFVQLCPDDAPVRKRMLYASSVRGLKSCLGLESLMQIQASDISDLDEKAIKHELMTHQRIHFITYLFFSFFLPLNAGYLLNIWRIESTVLVLSS